MELKALEEYLNTLLRVTDYHDYCPNGVQVEGRTEINRLVTGVTASLALLEAAVEAGADAVLVHHGYFWKGERSPITGIKKRRLQLLLTHNLSLIAYHLPLDGHRELGNNAQLGRHWGLTPNRYCGDHALVAVADLSHPLSMEQILTTLTTDLNRPPLRLEGDGRVIRSVAWCSGGAQDYFEAAIEAGADLFITGEVSEPVFHLVQESGVAYIAAGHHATERYGIAALGDHLAKHWGIAHRFIDLHNPI